MHCSVEYAMLDFLGVQPPLFTCRGPQPIVEVDIFGFSAQPLTGGTGFFSISSWTQYVTAPMPVEANDVVCAYLPRILLTQPCETRSWREMSHGRMPCCANSTIRCLTRSGRGLPLTKTPPSWLMPPWPSKRTVNIIHSFRRRKLHVSLIKWNVPIQICHAKIP